MRVTEVRVKLMTEETAGNGRILAFVAITLDGCFVVRDLKVIGTAGDHFVAMPDRAATDRCAACRRKNPLTANYCSRCGAGLDGHRASNRPDGPTKLHADVAHPINRGCREMIQRAVLAAYADELARSTRPGYVSSWWSEEDGAGGDAPPAPRGPLAAHVA